MGAGREIKLNYFLWKRSQSVALPPGNSPECWPPCHSMQISCLVCSDHHAFYFQTRVSWVPLISRRAVMQQGERGCNVEPGIPRPDFALLLQPCWVSALSVTLGSCIEWPTRFLTELLICDSYCLRTTLLFADNINYPMWCVVFWWFCKESSEGWTWRELRQKVYRGLAFGVKINISKILPSHRKRRLQNDSLFAYNWEPD